MALLMNIRSFSFVNYIGVDDFSDRLSYNITSLVLTVISLLVTARTYGMKPIACYLPHAFGFEKGGLVDFVDQYCLTEGTYAIGVRDFHLSAEIPDGGLSGYADKKIYYYQWVPFVLAFQAVLCCLPRLIWRVVSFDRAGTDVGRIVKLAKEAADDSTCSENRKRLLTHITRLIQRMIKQRKDSPSEGEKRCWAPRTWFRRLTRWILPSQLSGSSLVLTYLFIKLAYLVNSVGQLVAMKAFLQLNDTQYGLPGVQLFSDVMAQRDWQNSMVFPRVGSCAVLMRSAADANWMFAQCALPVNMINEKVYIFLWFWFVIVSAVTVASIIIWSWRLALRFSPVNFVKDYLKLADNYGELRMNHTLLNQFVKRYLSRDGAFLLKMIALNCGDNVCADVISSMWESFLCKLNFREPHFQKGIIELECSDLSDVEWRKRRGILKRQQSAPSPSMTLRGSGSQDEIRQIRDSKVSRE